MRFDYFSVIGYLSVLLWMVVPILWVVHIRKPSHRWLCHIALIIAVVAFVFAKINSRQYVNKIQPDRSAELAARQEKLKAAEEDRSDEVAQVRFAEDASGEYLDLGGLEEADMKYMEHVASEAVPEWKKEKKERGAGQIDNSLEAQIGAKKRMKGVDAAASEDLSSRKEPVVMLDKEKAIADRLDALNLQIIRLLILAALAMVVVDYFRRINVYEEAYLPLPLPGAWLNSVTPVKPVTVRPSPARRSITEELAWLTKRGDPFVYMTDDPDAAGDLPASLPRFGKRWGLVDVIHVENEAEDISDDFVFETVWYGRGSFVVDSRERATALLGSFMEYMAMRKANLATVSNTVHMIWDCDASLDEEWQADFASLAKKTGVSLMLCSR